MFENYIFSGFGLSLGKYSITNEELEEAVEKEWLEKFDAERIASGENYQKWKKEIPDLTAFRYMAELKMGFKTRNHVVPFPPSRKKYETAQNALDLAIESVQEAIKDAGIHQEEVDAWLLSTATPHEYAPGLAATLKSYFVSDSNQSETMTLTSACGGFNYNIERAVLYFKTHPEAKHLVVCHTELMSELLVDTVEFVPFVTFADAASAVVISRSFAETKEGIIDFVNYEDPQMINFLGATEKGRMYMQAGIIKNRATANLVRNTQELLQKSNWNKEDIDILIPHQTGNAIVHETINLLSFPKEKTYQTVQYEHGNLSGASIPACFYCLSKENKLQKGNKILTATAGLGGENGAFTYLVPKERKQSSSYQTLKNKSCLITGATGDIGAAVAMEAAKRGAYLLLHYFSNQEKAEKLKKTIREKYHTKVDLFKADFSKEKEVRALIDELKKSYTEIDYLVHTAAITGGLGRASEVKVAEFDEVFQVNQWSPIALTKALSPIIKKAVLYVGSVAEDAEFSGSVSYLASKKGLHGFAAAFSDELLAKGVKSIYYMPGLVGGGMAKYLDEQQKKSAMMAIGQKELTSLEDIAKRIVSSLYIPKVLGANNEYEGVLTVRRDSYNHKDIHYSIQ